MRAGGVLELALVFGWVTVVVLRPPSRNGFGSEPPRVFEWIADGVVRSTSSRSGVATPLGSDTG